MLDKSSKAKEIKRLTTPISFKNSKAFDCDDRLISCVETIVDVRFIVEPRKDILTDDEILDFAPQSKAASKIKLKRGRGSNFDVLLINESLPWILGIYYVTIICLTIPFSFTYNFIGLLALLILFIIPFGYLFRVFNLKRYIKPYDSDNSFKTANTETQSYQSNENTLESLKKYEKEVKDLKVLFDVKEEIVRDLIKKRFEPPQITYDKFILTIDDCHKLFYSQIDATLDIIHMASEHTPRIDEEINNKINILKSIIDQLEDLTNELVINMNSDDESDMEVKNLLDDMENLIGSVKEY